MADVQVDVHDELRWDRRALAAAELVTDARAQQAGMTLRWPPVPVAAPEPERVLSHAGRSRPCSRAPAAGAGHDRRARRGRVRTPDQGGPADGGRAAAL